jgi:hypothetical protein
LLLCSISAVRVASNNMENEVYPIVKTKISPA